MWGVGGGIVYPVIFAKGIILLSETVTGLQTQLNSLCPVASTRKLNLNRNTSSIMVFERKWLAGI